MRSSNKVHHDAVKLPVFVESEHIAGSPAISASASIDSGDRIHVSLINIDLNNEQKTALELRGVSLKSVTGQVLTSEHMQDHNTFDAADKVKLRPFTDAAISRSTVTVNLPPKSMVTVEIIHD